MNIVCHIVKLRDGGVGGVFYDVVIGILSDRANRGVVEGACR